MEEEKKNDILKFSLDLKMRFESHNVNTEAFETILFLYKKKRNSYQFHFKLSELRRRVLASKQNKILLVF